MVKLWLMLWHERLLLGSITLIFTAIAIAYALLAQQWFRSEALLIPVSSKSTQGLSSQLGNLSALTALAGINLVGGGNTSEPEAVLRSRDLIREFIQKNNLLPVIFSEKWDTSTGRWKDTRLAKQPDLRDAIKYFQDNILTVQEDKKTGLVSLDVQWTNAAQAADWATQLVDLVNQRMRDRALAEAEANVAYLQQQLVTNSQASLQQAAGRLLEIELQKVMLARGNKDYAFRVVDRPEAPRRRSSPRRGLVVALGFLAGGIMGTIVVLGRRAFKDAPAFGQPRRAAVIILSGSSLDA